MIVPETVYEKDEEPIKLSNQLKNEMNMLGSHSKNFFDKKINNYDN